MSSRPIDEQKFKRLAIKRTNAAIKYIRLIGNLSNKSNYAYNQKDVAQIFNALDAEVRDVKQRFKTTKKMKFTLDQMDA